MPSGLRKLTVLREFKPFGLVAEALDGKPIYNFADKYDYFLFDPEIVRERDEMDDNDASVSPLSDQSDQEIFFRGNRAHYVKLGILDQRFTRDAPVQFKCEGYHHMLKERGLCLSQEQTDTEEAKQWQPLANQKPYALWFSKVIMQIVLLYSVAYFYITPDV